MIKIISQYEIDSAIHEACLSLIKETIGEENYNKGIGYYQINFNEYGNFSRPVYKYHDNFINQDYIKL